MKNLFTSIIVSMTFISCATNPNVVRTLDTRIEVKGNIGEGKLGLNDKHEAIIQHERQAQDELLIQDAVNMRLQDDLNHYEGELSECLKYMADERLGGSGQMPAMPNIDNLQTEAIATEEFGASEDGSLKIVKKTYYLERLKNARAYEKSIRSMTKVLKDQNASCQMKLEIARNKAGLPGKKIIAEGYFTQKGAWVQTRRGENSLSDALELQAERH
jgi:hypothetical protein